MLWECLSFHFFIHDINSTSSPTLTDSNFFVFTTYSFLLLIYNINVTFYPSLTYFNLFHFTTASSHFLIYNFKITFSTIITHSNLFLFATSFFTTMWYVRIQILLGGVTCCSTCSGCIIQKTGFFGEVFYVPSFSLFLAFFLCSVLQFTLHSDSSIDISWSHLWRDIFHINIIHPDNLTFVARNQRIFRYTLLHHHFEPQCHICPH